ncbi:response regulator [Ideonella sp. DXS29W]|uniref:Response regulator n=1 Tax=Ideonella lacteola TaxID=2984193 RepID=A0ABU9BZI9_9BURK
MSRVRILVVDDNAMNLALVGYLLTAAGCEVVSAAHGEQALSVLADDAAFDGILCDVQMPVMDGYEFARRVKAAPDWQHIPLVAITAQAMVGDRERILAAGFDDYLSKPLDPASFIATLASRVSGLAVPPTPPQRASDGEPRPRRGTEATILVLDDIPANLQLKRSLLEPLGFRVVTADRPDEALMLAREERPQLIISDVGMRESSGFEFIAQVKREPGLADVPFIFLSATHWDEEARLRGLALGAARYLRRPIDTDTLLREIRSCLGVAPVP